MSMQSIFIAILVEFSSQANKRPWLELRDSAGKQNEKEQGI